MFRYLVQLLILCFLLASCSSLMKDSELRDLKTNVDYDQAIKVEKFLEEPAPEKMEVPVAKPKPKKAIKPVPKTVAKTSPKKSPKKIYTMPQPKKNPSKNEVKPLAVKKKNVLEPKKLSPTPPRVDSPVVPAVIKTPKLKKTLEKKVPALEDSEGFDGRRPVNDAIRVGEKIRYKVSYFAVEAGKFDLSVRPFAKVNGRKAYHFHYKIKTSSLFSMFYAVEDVAETFVDYDLWRPINYEIHVKESKQVKETKSYFDWKKNRGFLFEKKKVPGQSVENLKKEWDILDWSQNVFSVAFYLREMHLRVGKTLKVRVGHEGKNLIMSAKVLRKEILDTPAGRYSTFVIRPTFEVDGIFKPTGDNLLWISADERKFILRIESKIKIGTIVSMVESIKK